MVRILTVYSDLRPPCPPYSCFHISGKQLNGLYNVYFGYENRLGDWVLAFSGTLAECRKYLKVMFKHYVELE